VTRASDRSTCSLTSAAALVKLPGRCAEQAHRRTPRLG
jgi:hypothetical protein